MVLVVDDQPDGASALARVLRHIGYEAHVLADGQATLDYLNDQGHAPQLVILDVRMPGMNGIECLRTIKSTPTLSEIPVVMYSADFSYALFKEALNAGAADFLVKGATAWTDLVATVHKYARVDPA